MGNMRLLALGCLMTALASTGLRAAEPADMTKPVQVYLLMGQSNMVGMGKVTGAETALENVIKAKGKYAYLVDGAGNWVARQDVRFVRFMQNKGLLNNDWLVVKPRTTFGPEFGIGQVVGNAVDAPVMLLKTCIGNRSLGWDYLPPGSKRFVENGKVYAGYKDKPDSWPADPDQGVATEPPPWLDKNGKPINWYAGLQYDEELAFVRQALAELPTYCPGATKYEIAGIFFWQGEKDNGNPVHAARYEENLVAFIRALRADLNCPGAKFVLATLGEAVMGSGNKVLEGQLAVDGTTGKYPDFKGNVATVYTHPMAQGGSGNSHYGGNAEVYMDIGEAMGRAMTGLASP